MSLFEKGQSLVNSNPEKAYPILLEASSIARQRNDWGTYALTVNSLCKIALAGHGDYNEVFGLAKEAVEILNKTKPDTALARLHFNLGEFYNGENGIDVPIRHYKRAAEIWKKLKGEWNAQVAMCYHSLGDVYKYNKFDFLEAERCYDKALLVRERINFQDKKVLYQNYYSLAATNRSQNDFEKALSYGSKTLELAQGLKNDKALEMSNSMVANIHRDMGDFTLARKYYLNAIEINKRTKDLANRAWHHTSLGELLKKNASYDEALRNFAISYDIYKKNDIGDEALFINLLINFIDTYRLKQDQENFQKKLVEIFREKLNNKERYTVFLILGDYHYASTHFDSALHYYQKALLSAVPAFKSTDTKDNPTEGMIGFVYYVSEGLAKKSAVFKSMFLVSKDMEHLRQSTRCLILAEKLLYQERNTLDMEDAKWTFLDSNYDLYENLISNLYDAYELLPQDSVFELAFRYFERSKSRSLADALTQAEQTQKISSEDSLLRLHGDLKRKLLTAQDLVNRELEKDNGSREIATLRDEIVTIDRSIQACKLAIETKYPGYFNAKYGHRDNDIAEIKKIIQPRGQVVLEYFWGSGGVYGLAINKDNVLFKRIGAPDSIGTVVQSVLNHLEDEHSSMNQEVYLNFTGGAHRLYQILVAPFESILADNSRIQIIPDGSIDRIPFEILLQEKAKSNQVNYRTLKYLIKSYVIGYAYSASTLVSKSRKVVRNPSLLAVGFTGGKRLRTADVTLDEIEGSELELDALARHFSSGRFLTGNEATETNFKELSPDFDIIHLAIHGKGDVNRNFSASLFFRSKYDSLDDGELHAYELYGLKLKALMAVLSSCESGLGKEYRGEGMISMASAFTYSGCANVLMSLWKVNDQASIKLMDDFYGNLLKGESIDNALRTAKLNYLETSDELTADPKVWAPLVAYGNLDQIFEKDNSRIITVTITMIGIVIILLATFLLTRKKTRI